MKLVFAAMLFVFVGCACEQPPIPQPTPEPTATEVYHGPDVIYQHRH